MKLQFAARVIFNSMALSLTISSSNNFSSESVITSYSIHYTKLYDPKKLATKYYLLEGALLLLFTLIISVIPIIIVNRLFIKAYHINLINGNLSYILVMVSLFVTICLLISILTALKYVGSQAISKVYRLKKGVSVNHGIIVAQYALTISLFVITSYSIHYTKLYEVR